MTTAFSETAKPVTLGYIDGEGVLVIALARLLSFAVRGGHPEWIILCTTIVGM